MGRAPRHARTLHEALSLCARHGRASIAEGGYALAAAVDALSFALFGCASDESALEPFWLLAVEFGAVVGTPSEESESVLAVLAEALDLEIERWKKRGSDDPEARFVAEAFAELRALLRGCSGAGPQRGDPRRRERGAGARHASRTSQAG